MAGSKVNDYGLGDVQADSIMTTLDDQRIGFHSLTLTEFDTDTKPAIAAGSKVEVNGALFKFDTEEAISQTPADGTVYIILKPSGDSITAEFTATAPAWSDSKQGWYGEGGSSNYRYANFIMTKAAPDYSDKRTMLHEQIQNVDNFNIVNLIASTTSILTGTTINSFTDQSIGANGYITIGVIIIQWGYFSGTLSGGGSLGVLFPKTFPNNAYTVVTKDATGSNGYLISALVAGSFTVNGTPAAAANGYWIAIGN